MGPNLLIDSNFCSDHANLFDTLLRNTSWDDRMAARRTASFGRPYNYSQLAYEEIAIPELLAPLIESLHDRLNIRFNNCLMNYYETGENTMGFHSDDTAGLVAGTGVAIVSLGNVRKITYRSKSDAKIEFSYDLTPGTLLYMDADVQEKWLHAIRRQKGAGPRISLTWRAIA